MKFAYDASKEQLIINHENRMPETYSGRIGRYSSELEVYDRSLEGGLFRFDFSTGIRSERRLPFHNGDACYVYCEVQRDGQ